METTETSEIAKQYDKIEIGVFQFGCTTNNFWAQYTKSCADMVTANKGKPLVIIKQVNSASAMEVMVDKMQGKIMVKTKEMVIIHNHITYYKAVQPGYELQPGEKYLTVG